MIKRKKSLYLLLNSKIPMIKKIKKMATKIKNSTFAIVAEAAAIPVKPKSPAMTAMIKKTNAHQSIFTPFRIIDPFEEPCS